MPTAVVDFDKTLLKIDSTMWMLRDGYACGSLSIVFWGVILFFIRLLLPYSRQVFFRRKFRYVLFQEIYRRGATGVINEYAKKFAPFLNQELVQHIQSNYDKVFISTAAWKDLVEAIFANENIKGWVVQGTEYTQNFNKFKTCWYQEKVTRLETLGVTRFDLFTDSEEDQPLMNVAEHVFLVTGTNFVPYV